MSRHRNPQPRTYTLMEVLKAWLRPSRHFNPYRVYKEQA